MNVFQRLRCCGASLIVVALLCGLVTGAPAGRAGEAPEDSRGIAITDQEVLDVVLQVQGAAEGGNLEKIRDLLTKDSYSFLERSLESADLKPEEFSVLLPKLRHPARFNRVFRLGEKSDDGKKRCQQIILPHERRYGYLDGPVEEPFGFKQIAFWACFHRVDGRVKVQLGFPLNDLVCLLQ
ncbi:MAG: hypothetical protein HC834_11005 [Rhodospirillales bacterium]|nr:hypothetical protein [Rhodospirillales bacterium]